MSRERSEPLEFPNSLTYGRIYGGDSVRRAARVSLDRHTRERDTIAPISAQLPFIFYLFHFFIHYHVSDSRSSHFYDTSDLLIRHL